MIRFNWRLSNVSISGVISVSGQVKPGKNVTVSCSSFSSAPSMISWFKIPAKLYVPLWGLCIVDSTRVNIPGKIVLNNYFKCKSFFKNLQWIIQLFNSSFLKCALSGMQSSLWFNDLSNHHNNLVQRSAKEHSSSKTPWMWKGYQQICS